MSLWERYWYAEETRVTPDGVFYLAQAEGDAVPFPYRLRGLLPRLLGPSRLRWHRMNSISLVVLSAGLWVYTGSPLAILFLLCFPLLSFWRNAPILQDLPALALAVWAANVLGWNTSAGIVFALLAGLVNEKAPLFAALYAWSPFPLIGYLSTGISYLGTREGPMPERITAQPEMCEEMEYVLAHPFRSAQRFLRSRWGDGGLWIQPWGGMVLALFNPSFQLGATTAVAFGMCFTATDSLRMMVWALPVVAAAVAGLQWEAAVAALALSWFWGRNGKCW